MDVGVGGTVMFGRGGVGELLLLGARGVEKGGETEIGVVRAVKGSEFRRPISLSTTVNFEEEWDLHVHKPQPLRLGLDLLQLGHPNRNLVLAKPDQPLVLEIKVEPLFLVFVHGLSDMLGLIPGEESRSEEIMRGRSLERLLGGETAGGGGGVQRGGDDRVGRQGQEGEQGDEAEHCGYVVKQVVQGELECGRRTMRREVR